MRQIVRFAAGLRQDVAHTFRPLCEQQFANPLQNLRGCLYASTKVLVESAVPGIDLIERGLQIIRFGGKQFASYVFWHGKQRMMCVGKTEMAVLSRQDELFEITGFIRQQVVGDDRFV